MQTKALKINIFEKRALAGLFVVMFILACLYGYFIGSSIINTLVRGEIEKDMAVISSDISGLESEYIARKDLIDGDFAYSMGFVDVSKKRFVSRTLFVGKGLSLNQ